MAEKIGIPLNLLVSAGLLFFLFQGKDLGATLTTVSYEDEEGKKVERRIPKSEFRKSIAVFPFDNAGEDTSLAWLQNGLMILVMLDLVQDIYLNPDLGFYEHNVAEMKTAGYPDGVGIPLSYKRKAAREMYKDYFVSGSFKIEEDLCHLSVFLHQTKGLKQIYNMSYSGQDIFKIVDQITVEIKRNLGIPEGYIEESEDVSIAEMGTSSLEAFKYFVLAENTILSKFDVQKIREYYEMALVEDSTFAGAYMKLAGIYDIQREDKLRSWALESMMKYIYRLPGKLQFKAKELYYEYRGDKDKLFALIKMQVELYPHDHSARESLAMHYLRRNEVEKAIEQYKIIMGGSSDEGKIIQRIGSLYIDRLEFDQALQFYQKYAELNPKDYRSYTGLGKTYLAMSDFEKARELYTKAQLLEPTNLDIQLNLAKIEIKFGNFDDAEQIYLGALKKRKSPDERIKINEQLGYFYTHKGQLSLSLECGKKWLEDFKKSAQYYEVIYQWQRAYMATDYACIGRTDTALIILRDVEKAIGKTDNHIPALYYMFVYLHLENPDGAEKYVDNVGFDFNRRADHYFGKARINELRLQFDQALQDYEECLSRDIENEKVYVAMGRTYRKMGQYDESEKTLNQALRLEPFYVHGLYEMALLYWERGDEEKAIKYISKVLDIWKDADPEYIYAQKARQKWAEWQAD